MPFAYDESKEKACSHCHVPHPLNQQWWTTKGECKLMVRVRHKAWRTTNAATYMAQQKRYRTTNAVKIAARRKMYRTANAGKMSAYQKAYRTANAAKISAYHKAWRTATALKKTD